MEFDWDSGNILKSLMKHGISKEESEQIFSNPYLMLIDEKRSMTEVRFYVIGETDEGKILFVVFTTRENKIRVISARNADKKERNRYEAQKA